MDNKLNINIKYNKMKNFSIIALFYSAVIFAQVGVGTNTPNASAMLDVTSTSKGFLQPRVALTGSSDSTTIASPAAGLMIYNTATAGTGASAVTPGLYYYSGSAWQRLANQAEVAAATASTTTFVNGTIGSPLNTMMSSGPSLSSWGAKNFGASITLPPGKWEVVLDLTVDIQLQSTPTNIPAWINYWLDTTSPSATFSYFSVIPGTSVGTTDALFTGSAAFVRQITGYASNHNGKFYINNTTQSDKTYSLYFFESVPVICLTKAADPVKRASVVPTLVPGITEK
jgi:hypothetical protein